MKDAKERERAIEWAKYAIQALTRNLMQIAAGGGKSHEVTGQMVDALEEISKIGTGWHINNAITDALEPVMRERPERLLADVFEPDPERGLNDVVTGALRLAAARLGAGADFRRAYAERAEKLIRDGIEEIEKGDRRRREARDARSGGGK